MIWLPLSSTFDKVASQKRKAVKRHTFYIHMIGSPKIALKHENAKTEWTEFLDPPHT